MSRVNVAITISEENLAWIDENYNNRSALINDLLSRARKGEGEIEQAVARYQKEQLERERATLETQMEGVEAQLETVEKRLERQSEHKQIQLEEAQEKLQGVPRDPTNPGVKRQAEKLEITPEELLERLANAGGDEE